MVNNLPAILETRIQSLEGGDGNPLQYSCLENPMDIGVWQEALYGVGRVGHDLATKPPPEEFHTGTLLRSLPY